MSPPWIVEAVDVLEEGQFDVAACRPGSSPDHLSLQGLEEGLDGGVIVAVSLATHRYLEAVPAQDLLIVVRTILAAAVGMLDATLGRPPQGDRHVQRPDRQIFLQPVADRPADHAPGMQIENDGQINPAFPGPDVADVARPFFVWMICMEIPTQKVRRDVERMIAIPLLSY